MLYKLDAAEIKRRHNREMLMLTGYIFLIIGLAWFYITFMDVETLLGKVFIIPLLFVGYLLSKEGTVKEIDKSILLFESRQAKNNFKIQYSIEENEFTYFLRNKKKTKQELIVEISTEISCTSEDSIELIKFYEKECKRHGQKN